MTRFRHLLAAALLIGAGALAAIPAQAASQYMCRGNAAGAASGPARWVAPASGTGYSLNNNGCAIIAQADIGDAAAGGLVQSGGLQNILFTTGVMTSTTSVQGPSIPAGWYIREIIIDNSTANAVSGGIDIGKTSGAADIVSAKACAANCLSFVADSALLLRVFSKTASQATFITGHTDAASANLNLTYVIAPF